MLSHHPYSLDIFPSDFSRFGRMKDVLIGHEISDKIELLDIVTEISRDISRDELNVVFRNWIERVQNISDTDLGYVS
jgi:hypothetical protein